MDFTQKFLIYLPNNKPYAITFALLTNHYILPGFILLDAVVILCTYFYGMFSIKIGRPIQPTSQYVGSVFSLLCEISSIFLQILAIQNNVIFFSITF